MTLLISASVAATRLAVRATVPGKAMAEVKQATESPARVSLSERSQERPLAVSKANRSLSNALREADSSKKEAARRRIEDIKERIKMLRMLVSLGPASKGVMQEIRELAKALGQAAKVLGESGGDSKQAGTGERVAPAKVANAEPAGVKEEAAPLSQDSGQEQGADQKPDATDENSGDAAASRTAATLKLYLENQKHEGQRDQPNAADTRQRGADAELIVDAVRRLKALLALASSARNTDDPDSQKRMSEIQAHLEHSESIATGLGLLAVSSPGASVSVSV
jgi:hypothetical protein